MEFGAEEFLVQPPPDYPQERFYATIKLTMVVVFCLVILPTFMVNPVTPEGATEAEGDKADSKAETKTPPATTSNGKDKSKRKQKQKNKQPQKPLKSDPKIQPEEPAEQYELSQSALLQCSALCMVAFVWVMLQSNPHNYYTTRGIFQAPVFTRDECKEILAMADRAADINYKEAKSLESMYEVFAPPDDADDEGDGTGLNKTMKGLLYDPHGWQKHRHGLYPTTDLNVVTDPFTKTDRDFIRTKLDARLTPLISRIYGIPASSIRAIDMFVVRYDANKRTHLTRHTDDGDISFNILLDDGFEDGGTRFWNRRTDEPFAWIKPKQVGQVLLNSALISHEGMHITKGTRTIFVGFMSVDRVDPFDGTPTGLPWLASWGSLNWMTVKFKEGARAAEARIHLLKEESWRNHVFVRSLFDDLLHVLSAVGDVVLPHFSTNFIHPKDRVKYFKALDEAYDALPQEQRAVGGRANGFIEWFGGQQINVDITGSVSTYWQTRLQNEHRFERTEL